MSSQAAHESPNKNTIVSTVRTYYSYLNRYVYKLYTIFSTHPAPTYYDPDGSSSFVVTNETDSWDSDEYIFDEKTLFYQKWLRETYLLFAHYSANKQIGWQTRDFLSLLSSGIIAYMGIRKIVHDANKTIGIITTTLGASGSAFAIYDVYHHLTSNKKNTFS